MAIKSRYKLKTGEPIPHQFIGSPSLEEYEESIEVIVP